MMDDLTAFQRDVLYVIAGLEDESPPYGLAIKEELDRHYTNEINHGPVPPSLVLYQSSKTEFFLKHDVEQMDSLCPVGNYAIDNRLYYYSFPFRS
jgi:hypothetical protein